MMRPKFSIITVCYNSEKDIGNTVKSVLGQTYDNFEYIIIDGASEDGTLDAVYRVKESYDKDIIIVSEKDNGIYDAMNKGIDIACGEWLLFLNAADLLYDSDVLSKLSAIINDEYGIICGGTVYIKGNYVRKEMAKVTTLPYEMPSCHQSMLWRSDLIKCYKYDPNYLLCADRDCMFRMILDGIGYLCVDVGIAVYDCDGVSSNEFDRLTHEVLKIANKNGSAHDWKYRKTYLIWIRDIILVRLKKILPNIAYSILNNIKMQVEGWVRIYSENELKR